MIKVADKKITQAQILKFLIPSLIGIFIFMMPIVFNGDITIPIAVLSKLVLKTFQNVLPYSMAILIVISALGSIIIKTFKPKFMINIKFIKSLFDVSPIWFLIRILGMIFAVLTAFKIGPQWIWSEQTGGLLLFDLLPILFPVFLFAGLFLPLLLNFGLLEFFGTLLTKFMRPIFNLPGRSSIDCITSWLGDGSIGVLLTSKQYEDGYYSEKEAAVICTSFSAVSITFSLVVISQVNLSHMFIPFYLTVTLCGILIAIIVPRIPPLSRKKDSFFENKKQEIKEEIPEGFTPIKWGLIQAVERAEKNSSTKDLVVEGIKNILDMWIGVIPVVMAIGTVGVIIAEHTSIFQILGMPFIPILNLLGIPEAVAASQTLVVGFADMFLPTVIGATITSEMTRFVIACISVTQLIYMSEIGGLILGSKIPVSLKDLVIIFLERTLISLPIVAIAAHLLF